MTKKKPVTIVKWAKSCKNVQPFSCNNFVSKNEPCYAFLGGTACLTKFPKLVWTIAYSMQREKCKKC